MTDQPQDASPTPDAPPSNRGVKLIKGCGCVSGLAALALGILIIGHFDSAAWASALTAIIVGVLVFSLSGINGFWER